MFLPTTASPSIVFDDVRFQYESDKPFILNGLSLDVPAGKKTAIVGGSGSGCVLTKFNHIFSTFMIV